MDSRYLTSADGSKVYAEAFGDPMKPPIIFIHGITLSGAVFDNIFSNKDFNSTFYLVRYDLRGHGRSDKPENAEGYQSVRFAEDFLAVMSAFGLDKPIIVGWSYGATVLADIATNLQEGTISGAVYLGAVPYVGPVLSQVATADVQSVLPGLQQETDVNLAMRSIHQFSDLLFIDPSVIPWELKWNWSGMVTVQSPNVRQLLFARFQDPTALFKLGSDGFPLLIVHGKYDRQVDGQAVVDVMKTRFKNLDVCMIEKGGSHAVHIENEAEVTLSIQTFANKVFNLLLVKQFTGAVLSEKN